MHTGTRLVDLAILVRRANKYLAKMTKQLRALTFGSPEVDELRLKDDWADESIHLASSTLRTSLHNFEDIQTELVVFRDHLWNESVSGRPVDTAELPRADTPSHQTRTQSITQTQTIKQQRKGIKTNCDCDFELWF